MGLVSFNQVGLINLPALELGPMNSSIRRGTIEFLMGLAEYFHKKQRGRAYALPQSTEKENDYEEIMRFCVHDNTALRERLHKTRQVRGLPPTSISRWR